MLVNSMHRSRKHQRFVLVIVPTGIKGELSLRGVRLGSMSVLILNRPCLL